MLEFTIDKILLFTMFFVPGFIYLKSYRLFIAESRTDFSKDLYEAIGLSIINLIIFSYPLFLINNENYISEHPLLFFVVFGLILLIAPVLWAFIFYKISKKGWYLKFLISPTKSSWDSFFSKRESYYVLITLKNGKQIGGKYGVNSFASTFPNPKEIYIEEVWKLNKKGRFKSKNEQTEGMLITENEISTIEFFI